MQLITHMHGNGVHFHHRRSSKVRYLFSIADRGRNGYLSKEDLLELLHSLMGTTLRRVSLFL